MMCFSGTGAEAGPSWRSHAGARSHEYPRSHEPDGDSGGDTQGRGNRRQDHADLLANTFALICNRFLHIMGAVKIIIH